MKDEIKEILDRAKKLKYKCSCCEQIGKDVYISKYHEIETQNLIEAVYIIDKLLDYITNLEQENERLKQLCDKYEEEHNTTFNEWKETITDKYQTLKDLQEENEILQKRNKEIYDGFIATQKELSDYATKNEKAIVILNNIYLLDNVSISNNAVKEIDKAINILNVGDEEC